MTRAAQLDLRRDEITHRTLAICVAQIPLISREREGQHWHIYVNGLMIRNGLRLRTALTSLTKAELICWVKPFMSADVEHASVTEAGGLVLIEWDADLLSDDEYLTGGVA